MRTHDNQAVADIGVLVEGTYPYVTGGVSSWLHQLIAHLPQYSFSICHLASNEETDRTPKYALPLNVIEFQEIFLNSPARLTPWGSRRRVKGPWGEIERLHEASARGDIGAASEALETVSAAGSRQLDASDLLFSEDAWAALINQYSAHASHEPFLNYFWTFRSTHLPLFALHESILPRARLYHAVSTGYAGYAAALAAQREYRPMFVTEHGVYTRERDMELALAAWIDKPVHHNYLLRETPDKLREWWAAMFRFMSAITYRQADRIVSIAQVNQQYQLRDGADPDKLMVIPNGIHVERLARLRDGRQSSSSEFTVGFVGRVVPIKDVKCFIQAIAIASRAIPNLQAWIVGPTDEDVTYFDECHKLARSLDLNNKVHFSGRTDVTAYYAKIDALALTSLSEGQPLVILEANCAGIPVVATDVGSCRDLLEGGSPEDKALGPSGLLTLPASPQETADAIIQLWRDPELRAQMAGAGRERVSRYYREESVYAAYDQLYSEYLESARVMQASA